MTACGCPATTFVDQASAEEAATAARARRVLKGRRPGGTTTTARYCPACSRWHLENTATRKARR